MKRKLLLSLILSGIASASQGSLQDTLCQFQSYTHIFMPRIVWTAKHCSSIDVLTALKYGDDPRQENWCSETALHWAAYYSQSVSTDHLLSYNADPNHSDLTGKTPLHWAFLPGTQKPKSHNKVVSRLLKTIPEKPLSTMALFGQQLWVPCKKTMLMTPLRVVP